MRWATRTLVAFAVVAAGCGDDNDGQLSAQPDCAGAIVEVGDVAMDEQDQAEVARLILGSLGMGALAETVPDPLPTSGSDGFVVLDDARVVYAEDGRALGAFAQGGGSVCHSLQEEYYALP